MINPKKVISLLKINKTDFFTGVPDSVLKELTILLEKKSKKNHIIAANEGAAVSIGIGNYLATKKVPAIYMQNSGLSNALNPLISIAHQRVYSIPLILIIGWRGSPKVKDEPQHKLKGEITKKILNLLKIKYTVLRSDKDLSRFAKQIKSAKKNKSIVACLIEQGTLNKNKNKNYKIKDKRLNKEFFLRNLLESFQPNTRVISSTGYTSRELLYLRNKYMFKNSKDFYMVGGMGHTSSVALGYSLSKKNKTVCIDGDGSLLMHLGSIKTAATFAKENFKYILLNNNCHDSVGGQLTYANDVDFKKLSISLGFQNFYQIKNDKNIKKVIKRFLTGKSLNFLEVKISNNKIKKLPRPSDLIKIKNKFIS